MKQRSTTYSGFGIRIRTPFPLHDLPETEGSHDVTILPGHLPGSLVDPLFENGNVVERKGARFGFSPDAIYLEWERVGKVLIRGGTEVIVEKAADATMDDLSPFLTGPILASLLHQRNYFVLHASCIAIGGAAVVFVGPKGYGKSTLAAHLRMRGHRIVSDDIVPLRTDSEGVWTEPGFPRVKLFDDSIEAIGASPTDFPMVHRFATKRSLYLSDGEDRRSVEMKGIYILNEGDELQMVELSKAEAFIEVMRNAHLGRFLGDTGREANYFQMCKEITNTVPVFRLDRPSSFSEMPQTLSGIEAHVAEIITEEARCSTALL